MALQDFESDAFVGRNRFLLEDGTLGMLATARFNDDGSHNVVIGADGTWTPSPMDQFTAQFLSSQISNPKRPDLLDSWTGQQLQGSAYALGWTRNAHSGLARSNTIHTLEALGLEWLRYSGRSVHAHERSQPLPLSRGESSGDALRPVTHSDANGGRGRQRIESDVQSWSGCSRFA